MSWLKQHLGSAKPAFSASKRVKSQLQMAHSTIDSEYNTEVEMLKNQIADISAQRNSMTAKSQKHKLPKQTITTVASNAKAEARPVKKNVTSQQSSAVKVSSKPALGTAFNVGKMVTLSQFVKMSQILPL